MKTIYVFSSVFLYEFCGDQAAARIIGTEVIRFSVCWQVAHTNNLSEVNKLSEKTQTLKQNII